MTMCDVLSISLKELKALLPQLNYKTPSSRVLKDRLQVTSLSCPVMSSTCTSLSEALETRLMIELTYTWIYK